jgi:DNA-binding NarL/FixJ family response regulator
VLIVSGHFLVREYLQNKVRSTRHLACLAVATMVSECAPTANNHRPDLILFDANPREPESIAMVQQLQQRHPAARILALVGADDPRYCERLIQAGVRGCVCSRDGATPLLEAIRQVMAGELYLNDGLARQLARQLMGRKSGQLTTLVDELTAREQQILALLGRGYRTGEIAKQLFLSRKTVDTYYARLKSKLRLADSKDLAKTAIAWVHQDPGGSDGRSPR